MKLNGVRLELLCTCPNLDHPNPPPVTLDLEDEQESSVLYLGVCGSCGLELILTLTKETP